MKIVIVGAGFFGLYIAEYMAKSGHQVVVVDKEKAAMSRASYVNQARVHNGYHYPRSVLTALRSRVSFPQFNQEFADCIVNDFKKYYMVGKVLGKVTSTQFEKFCSRIGAYIEKAPENIRQLANAKLIEEVFCTTEHAFDAVKLKEIMLCRLDDLGVKIHYESTAIKVENLNGGLRVNVLKNGEDIWHEAEQVFNCTYSMINSLLSKSSIELIPFKHEVAEMCLVQPPEVFNKVGITVMCGPFFSLMPFPSKGLHSFSHVRYTPHCEWYDRTEGYEQSHELFKRMELKSVWKKMIQDSSRYIPILKECNYKESIWEVKTVLPQSETSDSRPILFKKNHGLKGLHCVMGGKIDNVFDAITFIEENGLV